MELVWLIAVLAPTRSKIDALDRAGMAIATHITANIGMIDFCMGSRIHGSVDQEQRIRTAFQAKHHNLRHLSRKFPVIGVVVVTTLSANFGEIMISRTTLAFATHGIIGLRRTTCLIGTQW